jgi:transposase InsO family protein
MSVQGNGFDDAMGETFFRTLKSEPVWRTVLRIRAEATAAIGRWIDSFHNPVRRHSALNLISPRRFERQAAQTRKRPPESWSKRIMEQVQPAGANIR